MTPKRIQLSRRKGWRMPANTVKVDRSTPYGNPFMVGVVFPVDADGCPYVGSKTWIAPTNAAESVGMFSKAYEAGTIFDFLHPRQFLDLTLRPLRGKNLACWCKLGEACHADILLKLANG